MSEEETIATNSQSTNSKAFNMVLFIDALINEVKKRPFLWDKKHKSYGCRRKVNRSWHIIATILKRRPDEVKAKWRNLKDSFHRLAKRTTLSSDDEGTAINNYRGQWIHFEKLLFLKDTRHGRSNNEDFIQTDTSMCIQDIKGEIEVSESSNESHGITCEKNEEPEKIFTEPVITLHSVLNGANIIPDSDPNDPNSRKRAILESNLDGIETKRRLIDLSTAEAVIEEDLHFLKSLVPFMRKLNPVRKLIVRNEMQNLLLKEMLCEHCRSFGPQPNCRCNLS